MNIQLVVKADSLTKTRRNSPVWGQIYLRGENFVFPESGWTDIAAGFCLYWIQALQRIETHRTEETVRFMDGPYKVIMRRVRDDSVELDMIECRDQDRVKQKAIGSLKGLLQDAVFTAQIILRTSEQNRWTDGDIEALTATVAGVKLP